MASSFHRVATSMPPVEVANDDDNWFDIPLENLPSSDERSSENKIQGENGENDGKSQSEQESESEFPQDTHDIPHFSVENERKSAKSKSAQKKPAIQPNEDGSYDNPAFVPSDAESEQSNDWDKVVWDMLTEDKEIGDALLDTEGDTLDSGTDTDLPKLLPSSRFKNPGNFWKERFSKDYWEILNITPPGSSHGSAVNVPTGIEQSNEIIDDGEEQNSDADKITSAKSNSSADESKARPGKSKTRKKQSIAPKSGSKWVLNSKRKRRFSMTQKIVDGIFANDNWICTDLESTEPPKKLAKASRKRKESKGFIARYNRQRKKIRERKKFLQRKQVKSLPAEPTYLHILLKLLYCCCLSPYKRNRKAREHMSRRELALDILHEIIFGVFVTLATSKTFFDIKLSSIKFLEERNPQDLFGVAFIAFLGALQTYTFYFLAFKQRQITDTLDKWEYYDTQSKRESEAFQCDRNTTSSHKKKRKNTVVATLVVVSILFGIAQPTLYDGFTYWSFPLMIAQHAGDFTVDLAVWSTTANETEIFNQVTTYPASKLYFFGMTGWSMKIFSQLQVDTARNILALACFVNNEYITRFGEVVKQCLSYVLPFLSSLENDLKCWKLYRLAKDVNAVTNNTFNFMIGLYHANNFIMITYLMTLFLKKDTKVIEIIFISYELIKSLYTYWTARKTSKYNETTDQWIRKLPCDTKMFVVEHVHFTRPVMLHELEKEPFGFGSGLFRIDDTFLYKGIGAVGSMVMVLITVQYV